MPDTIDKEAADIRRTVGFADNGNVAEENSSEGEELDKTDSGSEDHGVPDASGEADAAPESAPEEELRDDGATDYEELMRLDVMELRRSFSELKSLGSITELENPMRYAELRDLGLTAKEAYLATSGSHSRRDNRGHLSSAVPRGATSPRGSMAREELSKMRELFPGLGDAEIQGLYRKVNV